MKKIIVALVFLLGITTLLMAGCKERQVSKIIDVATNDVTDDGVKTSDDSEDTELTEPEATVPAQEEDSMTEYESAENKDNPEASTTEIPKATDVNKDSTIDKVIDEEIDEKTETVIVVKSENLEEIDERALMLKELDDLLESVLATLDEVEEDDLSEDNTFDEGGD